MSGSITAVSRSAAYVDADNVSDRIEPGNTVQFDAVIRYQDVDTDPIDLILRVTNPSGVHTVYTYGVDPELTKTTIGQYHAEIVIPDLQSSVGTWQWQWLADGEGFSTQISGETVVSDEKDTVTITVQDADEVLVSSALVSVFNIHGGLVTQKKTNISGVASMVLEDGTYQVEIEKEGFRAPLTKLVVSGSSAAVITAIDLKIQAPIPTLRLCRIYGHVIDMTGHPFIDADVLVEPVGVAVRAYVRQGGSGINPLNQGVMRDKRAIRARNSDGYWEIDLVCGSIIRINIPSLGLIRMFRVPEVAAINLADVRTDVTSASLGAATGERYPLV